MLHHFCLAPFFRLQVQSFRSILFLLFTAFALQMTAQKFEGLAMTPPMGWNSWNKFACDGINEQVIRSTADAMVSTGMRDAGYQYVVIDDCWQVGRDSMGNILADPQKFPSGIKALADYIHARGLKFGIYTCAGTKTCAGRPASRGYEFQDARQYARWGVDYLKEDWCNTSTQDPKESYRLMRDALHQAGRPIVFSLCEWGMSKPWLWAADVGHCWRTTGDISNNWAQFYSEEGKVWGGGVLTNLKMQHGLEKYAGPGHWNDPDMLELGNGILTPEEERAHFSLWCMLAAPLMAGNDLAKMSERTRLLLTDKEVIAIDQDPLGRQGYEIMDDPDWLVFLKPLSGGDTAICFLNKSGEAKDLQFDWTQHGISRHLQVLDIWARQNIGTTATPLKRKIARHDIALVRLHGQAVADETLPPASADYDVYVDGKKIFVYDSPVPAAYCSFDINHTVTIQIRAHRDIKWVDMRPAGKNIHPVFKDSLISFQLDRPMQLSMELNGSIHRPLFIFANPPQASRPDPKDPQTHFFAAGKIYHPGIIEMHSGETLYIEEGAIVAGSIHAKGARHIRIAGRGILDGSNNSSDTSYHRSVDLEDCEDVSLEDITLHNSRSWQIVPIHCRRVTIANVKIVSDQPSDDGIDIVRSSHVSIRHCFIRTKDDCIAIKTTMDYPATEGVDSVSVEDCVFWNGAWGNGLEIGFELNSQTIRNVLFRNSDIIHVQDGAAFSIHNAGRCEVKDILFDDVRVEDANQKLFDLSIFRSRYSEDSARDPLENNRLYLNGAWDGVLTVPPSERTAHAGFRGRIDGIVFRNIQVIDGPLPYSIFCGYDNAHKVENVRIENLTVRGEKVQSLARAKCYLENTANISIQ